MATDSKVYQLDMFIKEKEQVEAVLKEAKKRNFSRRINHLFGELSKLKSDIEKADVMEE